MTEKYTCVKVTEGGTGGMVIGEHPTFVAAALQRNQCDIQETRGPGCEEGAAGVHIKMPDGSWWPADYEDNQNPKNWK